MLRQQGMTVSLDTNWSAAGDWETVREILGYVDVFAPNEQEALHVSGMDNAEDAGEWLSRHVKLTVIKRGARGAMAFDRESGDRVDLAGTALDERSIADTTGAGDNFDAGFLFAWLKGAPLANCVKLGMRCGTASLARMGGIEGQLVGGAEFY
jgi:sugar/nucleoside kinase (ribokinase family)